MYTEETTNIQYEWSSAGLALLRELLPLMKPVSVYSGWRKEERNTIGMLLTSAARSSESALLLCAYGQLWDAEMVLRSVLESTLKFAYLLESENTFKERHEEYAEALFYIGLLKDHAKAEELLAVVPYPDSFEWKPIRDRLLVDDELHRIKSRYDSKTRKRLVSKWGFTNILNSLSAGDNEVFRILPSLLHTYSISSHIQHADYIGTSVVFDRECREEDNRDALHVSHLSRLINEALTYLYLRIYCGYKFVGEDIDNIKDKLIELHKFMQELSSAYKDWQDIEYKAN